MVKVRKESNEWEEEEASLPVPVYELGIDRLEQLRDQYVKPEPARKPPRARKRKKAGRRYRLVTDQEAAEIWRRAELG